MSIVITFRKTPKDIIKWEIGIRIKKKHCYWFLVFRPISIMLWRDFPFLICYFGWRNPYTKKLRFGIGMVNK